MGRNAQALTQSPCCRVTPLSGLGEIRLERFEVLLRLKDLHGGCHARIQPFLLPPPDHLGLSNRFLQTRLLGPLEIVLPVYRGHIKQNAIDFGPEVLDRTVEFPLSHAESHLVLTLAETIPQGLLNTQVDPRVPGGVHHQKLSR